MSKPQKNINVKLTLSFECKLFVDKINKIVLFKNKNEDHLNNEIFKSQVLSTFVKLQVHVCISGSLLSGDHIFVHIFSAAEKVLLNLTS